MDRTTTYQCVTPACMVWRQWRGQNNNIPVCYTSLYGLETVAWTEQQHTSVLHQPVWSGDSGVDRTTTYQCVTPACMVWRQWRGRNNNIPVCYTSMPVWSGDSGVDGTTTYQCVTPACMVWRQWRGQNNNNRSCKCVRITGFVE